MRQINDVSNMLRYQMISRTVCLIVTIDISEQVNVFSQIIGRLRAAEFTSSLVIILVVVVVDHI